MVSALSFDDELCFGFRLIPSGSWNCFEFIFSTEMVLVLVEIFCESLQSCSFHGTHKPHYVGACVQGRIIYDDEVRPIVFRRSHADSLCSFFIESVGSRPSV